jgi:mevalonate kinase
VGAGLGSSAAVAVAFSAAYAGVHGVELDKSLINEAAYAAEEYNHGRPSGIDNTVASYGGLVLYKRGLGVKPLESRVELDALIVNTRIQRSTRRAVEYFQRNLSILEDIREDLIRLVDKLVLRGVELLEKGAIERFGRIMFLSHGLLNGMGVSIPELDWIVHTASAHGAYGAKLTGAGMGGSAIVVGDENALSAVEKECKKRGFEVYRVRLGVEGVKLKCK